ncbi:MAG: fused MFS/spermidine synthase, partial [Candidatus Delongbacteria bacterium]|nr:fused MFS/spermidine synthase [Candidatus Delongbacteria bacterium]MCG2760454.1 fused MFS/spermidine synthase [Candidatus Delongbacteria bacterium]
MSHDIKIERMILTLVVFLASVSFLAYEVTWNRILGLYLGTTVHASTIVISAFMGGLGIGAYFWGKRTTLSKHPVKILTFIILALSAINIVTYHLLMLIPDMYGILSSGTEISVFTEIIVYAYSLLSILGSAFFIGGIMPAASRIYIELGNEVSDSLGNTYAADTLGSAVGGMLTGFVLLGMTGMSGTVYLFSILNIFIAVFFFRY